MAPRGGKRERAGRKPKEGWKDRNLNYEVSTLDMLKEYSDKTGQPQSQIANEILSKRLKSLLKSAT
jgi:hypothetical protein